MNTLYPVSGAFVHYSARFMDPACGFARGWNYWYSYAITLPTEITAPSLVFVLLTIFRYAREAAEVRPKGTEVLSGMSRYDVPSATYTDTGGLEGSRTAGQRWCLRLALVCKGWAKPARAIAFVFLRLPPHQRALI